MIQSLERAIQMLLLLAEKDSCSVTELAGLLDVNKSTVSRMISTLKKFDLVQMDASKKNYKLGYRILHLGEALKRNVNVIDIARAYLTELSKKLGQSVHLCTYSNGGVYVVDQVKSDRKYTLNAAIGIQEPLHASSVGKCILAYRPADVIDRILTNYRFEKFTEKTIIDKEKMLQELATIRKRGYAIDDQEVCLGVECIAVPIFSFRGSVFHTIGISGPKRLRYTSEEQRIIGIMRETALAISKEIGYRGDAR